MRNPLLVLALPLLLLAPASAQTPPNLLLVVADDLGIDNVGAYDFHPEAAPTPALDNLARQGVLFSRAYANPACSPTRATLLTGQYAWHTGVGTVLSPSGGPGLQTSVTTLPQVLAEAGYTSAAVGKWHLGDDPAHPLQMGFAHHRGTMNNIQAPFSYDHYPKATDGVYDISNEYATTETVDDALEFIGTLPEPWFVYVAFNAVHEPYHAPPPELHTYDLPEDIAGNEAIYGRAMIQSLDTEFGRLLAGVDLEDTLVTFVSDNGPEPETVLPPLDPSHAKGTHFDLGVHVPLIVAGAGSASEARCDALVNTTDVFATLARAAGLPGLSGIDSVSLRPYLAVPERPSIRRFVYTESFTPNFTPEEGWPHMEGFIRRHQAARSQRHKLIVKYYAYSPLVDPLDVRLYDLVADPLEEHNLMLHPLAPGVQKAFDVLMAELIRQQPGPFPELLGTPY